MGEGWGVQRYEHDANSICDSILMEYITAGLFHPVKGKAAFQSEHVQVHACGSGLRALHSLGEWLSLC